MPTAIAAMTGIPTPIPAPIPAPMPAFAPLLRPPEELEDCGEVDAVTVDIADDTAFAEFEVAVDVEVDVIPEVLEVVVGLLRLK